MIKFPARFEQAKPAGFDGVFEWDFLEGCFPRNIMPMDFDGVVEINGNFLLFETKQPGRAVEKGQQYTFRALLESPNWTIFMLYGKTADTIERLIVCHGLEREDIRPANSYIVRREVMRWVKMAEANPKMKSISRSA